jgi:hypothetical protein
VEIFSLGGFGNSPLEFCYLMTFFFSFRSAISFLQQYFFWGPLKNNPTKIWGASPPLTMCAIPKKASKERIKTDFTSLMGDKYEEYDQIYTDGSLMDDKVGFAFVTNNQIIKKSMRSQSSIYSAEQQAIIMAMESTTQTNKPKIIATDSLSSLLAASGNRWTWNLKTRNIRR